MRRVCGQITLPIAVAGLVACGGRGTDGIKDSFIEPTVDPNACIEVSLKVKSFLEATVALHDVVASLEGEVKGSCQTIAEELGVPTEGDTTKVCDAVAAALMANLKAGLEGKAKLQIDYKPVVCEVNADLAAKAAARCEGTASADMKVQCTGTCEGSAGSSAGSGDDKATGGGTCSGRCSGSADVNASAECEAKAEVTANVEAECTPPELDIKFDASVVAGAPKVEATIKALKKGLPKLIAVRAKLEGPVALAFKSWAKAAAGLKATLNKMGLCVGAQLSMAVDLLGHIERSMSISVQASIAVSAAADR